MICTKCSKPVISLKVATDLNPIHDHDPKRFCVPGDLLFTGTIRRLGLYQSMHFDLSRMLAVMFTFNTHQRLKKVGTFITNSTGKKLVGIDITGKRLSNQSFAARFALDYVHLSEKSLQS